MSTNLPPRQNFGSIRSKFTIVASQYNEEFTQALIDNCQDELNIVQPGCTIELVRVPGAFEVPVAVKAVLNRTSTDTTDVVIALGVIIKGSTDHADLIGSSVTNALMQLGLEFTTPVIHEVLLLEDEKQAFARCIASQLNRGREAARAAAQMAELFHTTFKNA